MPCSGKEIFIIAHVVNRRFASQAGPSNGMQYNIFNGVRRNRQAAASVKLGTPIQFVSVPIVSFERLYNRRRTRLPLVQLQLRPPSLGPTMV